MPARSPRNVHLGFARSGLTSCWTELAATRRRRDPRPEAPVLGHRIVPRRGAAGPRGGGPSCPLRADRHPQQPSRTGDSPVCPRTTMFISQATNALGSTVWPPVSPTQPSTPGMRTRAGPRTPSGRVPRWRPGYPNEGSWRVPARQFRLCSWWLATVPYRWPGSPPCRVSSTWRPPSALTDGGRSSCLAELRPSVPVDRCVPPWVSPSSPRATVRSRGVRLEAGGSRSGRSRAWRRSARTDSVAPWQLAAQSSDDPGELDPKVA